MAGSALASALASAQAMVQVMALGTVTVWGWQSGSVPATVLASEAVMVSESVWESACWSEPALAMAKGWASVVPLWLAWRPVSASATVSVMASLDSA